MNKILKKRWITNSEANKVFEVVVDAPLIAKKSHGGNFVIIRLHENGERIPLTIADYDKERGTITMITQAMGKSTTLFSDLDEGDYILDLVGPLGNMIEVKKFDHPVVFVGGGIGIAPVYPQLREMKDAGNEVYCIMGARNKDLLFWQDKFEKLADKVIITTDDGSAGRKGFVTDALKELMESEPLSKVIAIGPLIMMKFVADLTRDKVPTDVSLNTIMVDGTGMCGGCRYSTLDGQTKYSCVDGPDVDGHNVDFNILLKRNNMFSELEQSSKKQYLKTRKDGHCRLLNEIKKIKPEEEGEL